MYWLIKALGKVSQEILVDKMEKCRPDDSIIWATHSWLKTYSPIVLMEGGREVPVTCQMVLSLVLFYSSLLWVTGYKEGILIKPADDTKLWEIPNAMESRFKSSQTSKWLQWTGTMSWTHEVEQDRDKCEFFHLDSKNQLHEHRVGKTWTETSSPQQKLIISVDHSQK